MPPHPLFSGTALILMGTGPSASALGLISQNPDHEGTGQPPAMIAINDRAFPLCQTPVLQRSEAECVVPHFQKEVFHALPKGTTLTAPIQHSNTDCTLKEGKGRGER